MESKFESKIKYSENSEINESIDMQEIDKEFLNQMYFKKKNFNS